jgi:hypothetical protein
VLCFDRDANRSGLPAVDLRQDDNSFQFMATACHLIGVMACGPGISQSETGKAPAEERDVSLSKAGDAEAVSGI